MIVTVNGHDLHLKLADNSSARALANLVAEDALQLTMEDYGGFEKVAPLPRRLPTNDERITTQPGDVILYQGDKLAIYYATNTWSFTRLGALVDLGENELREVLGGGSVTVTISG